VKKALHLSAIEQEKVISFCKSSILQQVPGSMYVCGCPGTGKSLTMEQVKLLSVSWAAEVRSLLSCSFRVAEVIPPA
jgi:cell division control protein 6